MNGFARVGTVLLGVAATSLVLLICSGCQSPSPFAIEPYLQNPTQTAITLQWAMAEPGEAIVNYGIDDVEEHQIGPIAGRQFVYYPQATRKEPTLGPSAVQYLYKVTLTGLAPGARYRYRVTLPAGRHEATFRTCPADTATFSFVGYGDTRSNAQTHRRIAERIRDANCDLIIHTGDLTDTGAYVQYQPQFFQPLRDVIDRAVIMPIPGNHDGFADVYNALFTPPGRGDWYSFDYANAHFVALDSSAEGDSRADMLDWLARDLSASKAQWKIVYYHYPSYDTSRRHTAEGREDLCPLFRKHGVDLVLTGHCHGYQRIHPLITRGENDDHPITYMVVAGGGAPLNAMMTSEFAACIEKAFCFTRFSIDRGKLTGRTIDIDGRTIDEFTIDKTGGRFAADYLAQAMPEQEFSRLRDLVDSQLKGIMLPELPQPGEPVTFSFPFKALDNAEVTIKLYPDSGDYGMDSVRVTVPAGQTRQVKVTLRAKTKVTAAVGSMLSPKIGFECHYRSGETTGVVMGGKLHLGQPSPSTAPATP